MMEIELAILILLIAICIGMIAFIARQARRDMERYEKLLNQQREDENPQPGDEESEPT